MNKIFSELDIKIIKEIYPIWGLKFLQSKLPHFSLEQLRAKTSVLKLKRINRTRFLPYDQYDINPQKFLNINSHYVAYFLGFLWADGYLSIRKTKNISFSLEICEEDALFIEKSLDEIGKFNKFRINHKNTNQKNTIKFHSSNPIIGQFLKENDYKIKSQVSPTKILSKIPTELHRYFWLGFFDGDGFIYLVKNKIKAAELAFTGTIEQNWMDLTLFLESIGCFNYRIEKTIRKNGSRYSTLRLSRGNEISLIGKIFYENESGLGLERKKNKFITVGNGRNHSKSGFYGVRKVKENKFIVEYKNKYYGTFYNVQQAAISYDKIVFSILGTKAKTNFPITNYFTNSSV